MELLWGNFYFHFLSNIHFVVHFLLIFIVQWGDSYLHLEVEIFTGIPCRENQSPTSSSPAPVLFCRDYQREQCSSKDHFGFIRGERKSSGWGISTQHAGRVFESMSRIERILLIVLFKLWLQKICWRR